MKKNKQYRLYSTIAFFLLFIFWTVALCLIDRQAIGPMESVVGLANLNAAAHTKIGVHMFLYELTDHLSVIPIAIMLAQAIIGAVQLIKYRSIRKVNREIICIGIVYAILFAVFIFFEILPVNYRPILIEGNLEASYPSSTTLLLMTVMGCCSVALRSKSSKFDIRSLLSTVSFIFAVFMVVSRIISGVHWITDILGGLFFSIGLISLYAYLIQKD